MSHLQMRQVLLIGIEQFLILPCTFCATKKEHHVPYLLQNIQFRPQL